MCAKYGMRTYIWPPLTGCMIILTFIISYIISTLNGHVYWYFPYISDTGAIPPESCVFGQMLNIAAVLMGITMYIRYRQYKFAYDAEVLTISPKWNSVGKWLGFTACIGLDLVANFQETSFGAIHFLGAILAFGLGSFYFIIDTRISFALRKNSSKYTISTFTLCLRVFLCVWILPLFITNVVVSKIAMAQFTGKNLYYWTPDDGAFELRLVATFTEWIMTIFMIIYILTFTNEFKSLEFSDINIKSNIIKEAHEEMRMI